MAGVSSLREGASVSMMFNTEMPDRSPSLPSGVPSDTPAPRAAGNLGPLRSLETLVLRELADYAAALPADGQVAEDLLSSLIAWDLAV